MDDIDFTILQLIMTIDMIEETCIRFILRCEREGVDCTQLRAMLDDVHAATDGIR